MTNKTYLWEHTPEHLLVLENISTPLKILQNSFDLLEQTNYWLASFDSSADGLIARTEDLIPELSNKYENNFF